MKVKWQGRVYKITWDMIVEDTEHVPGYKSNVTTVCDIDGVRCAAFCSVNDTYSRVEGRRLSLSRVLARRGMFGDRGLRRAIWEEFWKKHKGHKKEESSLIQSVEFFPSVPLTRQKKQPDDDPSSTPYVEGMVIAEKFFDNFQSRDSRFNDGFVEVFFKQHRTVQQSAGLMIFDVIRGGAKQYNAKQYDARNQAFLESCDEIVKADLAPSYLPYI